MNSRILYFLFLKAIFQNKNVTKLQKELSQGHIISFSGNLITTDGKLNRP